MAKIYKRTSYVKSYLCHFRKSLKLSNYLSSERKDVIRNKAFTEKEPYPKGTISHTMWRCSCNRVNIEYLSVSYTRDIVSSAIQISRISSKMLSSASYFQLSSRCLNIPMKHCSSCLIYYFKGFIRTRLFNSDSFPFFWVVSAVSEMFGEVVSVFTEMVS